MAYIRAGRVVRGGRQSFVPGGVACAAAARRFSLSIAPLFAPAPSDSAAADPASGQPRSAFSTQVICCGMPPLAAQPSA